MCSLCLVKEDLNLMTATFAILALLNRKWRHAAFLAVWGAVIYLITVKLLIPHFSPQGYTCLNQYTATLHATNSIELFINILIHPHHVIHLLISNHMKRQLWYLLFAPVACLALASPITLLAVPELLSRLLSPDPALWSSHYHYDAPLMPIVFLGAVDGLPRLISIVALYADRRRELETLRWASAAVPTGVTVQTTNRVAIPLLTLDTVTIPSDRPAGTWAVLDLNASPGEPAYVADLRHTGWHLVRQAGPIVVLHFTGTHPVTPSR